MPPSPVVGLIGAGRMGVPVCGVLVRAGHRVLAADTRPQQRAAVEHAGGEWMQVAEAAAGAEVLLTLLPGSAELAQAMTVAGAELRPGATWIDMTSTDPQVGAEIARSLSGAGVECLDAPVGGGVPAAERGTLELYVGGSPATVARHRPLLETLGHVNHMGAHGAGYTVKLLVNLLWFGQALATGEALLLARRAGVELDTVHAALRRSAAAGRFIEQDVDSLLAGDYLPSFGLDRCHEELAAITALAESLDVPFELSHAVERGYARALEHFGAIDGELLAVAELERRAGITLRRPANPAG